MDKAVMTPHQQTTNQAETLLNATFKALGVEEEPERKLPCRFCGAPITRPNVHACDDCLDGPESE